MSLNEELPYLKQYLTYYLEEKQTPDIPSIMFPGTHNHHQSSVPTLLLTELGFSLRLFLNTLATINLMNSALDMKVAGKPKQT